MVKSDELFTKTPQEKLEEKKLSFKKKKLYNYSNLDKAKNGGSQTNIKEYHS